MTETPKINDGLSPCETESLASVNETMLDELRHYTTMRERAAYRAGLSTAAAVCDCVAVENGARRPTLRNRKRFVVAQICGDRIWALRDKIETTIAVERSKSQGEQQS